MIPSINFISDNQHWYLFFYKHLCLWKSFAIHTVLHVWASLGKRMWITITDLKSQEFYLRLVESRLLSVDMVFFFQNGGVSFIGEGSLCIFLSMQSFLFQFADVIAIIRNKTRAMATPGALLVFEMSTESCKRLLYFVPFFPLNLNGYFLGIKNLWLTVYRSGSPWKTNYSMFINWRFVVVHNTIVIQ